MAQQTINIGSSANDGTGDPLRTAFDKINDNFNELYGSSPFGQQITISGNKISSNVSNANLVLEASGTGAIEMEGINIRDNHILATRSNDDLVMTASGTGAVQLTNMKLATGATVTGILDEDNMATNSATQLATQQSIKAYVDSQVTAQDLDFACDDSTTLSIDLDSESLQFSGGTGITTAGTSNTVTIAIDGTVATLTGAQTLTNKILTNPTINAASITGTATIDNLTFNDNTIGSSSNADINLTPGGTGSVVASGLSIKGTSISATDSATVNINDGVNVDGSITVQGTTNTADVATTGNTTISGSLTTGTLNVGDLNIIADGTITSDSNGDVVIDPAGTGAIVLTGPITATGTQTTTGQLNVDNLRLDGNTLSATTGGITITPATGSNVAVGGTNTKLTATEANFTLMEAPTVRTDTLSTDTSNADLTIGTQGTGKIVLDVDTMRRTGDFELDVSGSIYLDADGGTIFLQDGSAGFGQLLRSGSNDLTIASGSTQALIFTGANAAFQGNVTATGTVGTSQIAMEGNRIKTTASNADLQFETAGTGLIDLETPTQMTVGAVGAATHLPLDSANEIRPVGYLRIKISGTEYVIPYFNAS